MEEQHVSTQLIAKEAVEKKDKLCGYLYRLASKSLMKTSKRRWFAFSENTCKLYYYSAPHESNCLGEIDISSATFSFEVTNLERPGIFFISTPDKQYELEANDRQTALFWLQELQLKRKEFCRRRNSNSMSDKFSRAHSFGRPECGLLHSSPISSEPSSVDVAVSAIFSPVSCPKGNVGEESADSKRTSRSWSFNSIKDQVVNSVTNRNRINDDDGVLSSSPELDTLPRRKRSFQLKFSRPKSVEKNTPSKEVPTVMKIDDDIAANREIVYILQSQVDYLTRQNDSLSKAVMNTYSEQEVSNQKDSEIFELTHILRTKERELQDLQNQLDQSKIDIRNASEQLDMYQQTIQVKDELVVQLTNQIGQLNQPQPFIRQDMKGSTKNLAMEDDISHFKDSLQAYQMQNKFLNKEILELNQLRKESESREEHLIIRCSEWEAKYYQIKSKYLLLLNDLHVPRKDDEQRGMQDVVKQLLEDALSQPQSNFKDIKNLQSDFDECGFAKVKYDEDSIESMASNYQRRCENLTNLIEDADDKLLHSQWETYILNIGDKGFYRNQEIKSLVRLGIPLEHRSKIWMSCINVWVKPIKDKFKPGYYNSLLSTHNDVSRLDPAAKQIELDLLRTLPNNKHYATQHSDGIPRLRRVLLAYSWHNNEVSYCQGLNRLAAIALLFLNEEDAFWCLVAIVECIMPVGYYSKTLIGALVDQRVLKDLVSEKLPRLQMHFDAHRVDVSLFTFNWFLCVFIDAIPHSVYLRIWDVFFYEGSKVLFRFALAFFKMHEEELLLCNDVMKVSRFFRSAAENLTEVKRFTHENQKPLQSIIERYIFRTIIPLLSNHKTIFGANIVFSVVVIMERCIK
uniref:TBC1 domain family member 2B n=1 Tax=Strigamia maritima TaxID=126957 RepID=T1JBD8_STRMM